MKHIWSLNIHFREKNSKEWKTTMWLIMLHMQSCFFPMTTNLFLIIEQSMEGFFFENIACEKVGAFFPLWKTDWIYHEVQTACLEVVFKFLSQRLPIKIRSLSIKSKADYIRKKLCARNLGLLSFLRKLIKSSRTTMMIDHSHFS